MDVFFVCEVGGGRTSEHCRATQEKADELKLSWENEFPEKKFEVVRFSSIAPTPQAGALARAIFNTDRRVEEDVFKNGCEHTSKGSGEYFQRAWDKNINGWRSEAEARAAAILGVLGK